jgi:hypothetical protein
MVIARFSFVPYCCPTALRFQGTSGTRVYPHPRFFLGAGHAGEDPGIPRRTGIPGSWVYPLPPVPPRPQGGWKLYNRPSGLGNDRT